MAEETQTTPAEGKSSLWVWVIVVVAVVFGGYYLFARQATAPSITEDAVEEGAVEEPATYEGEPVVDEVQTEAEVTYEDGVFTPKSLTVKTGSIVTFKNIGTEEMWIASAPHPEHTDYPGFDQKEAVENGGTYSFTFEKTGSWRYHNHKNPTAVGSIIVTE